jgi:addiction module RelB/DinJ family antitoxin
MTSIHVTVDDAVKRQAMEIFERKGITMSEAIRSFLKQVSTEGDLPFSLDIPNHKTQKVLRDTDNGIGLEPAVTLEELDALWDEK